ncbi:MAG: amino acid ABC transporter ATP-binding protein [Clostridia bacterium]|nr:amino acid ABC transporter ATP-binding protein [Clostridia bacterium]
MAFLEVKNLIKNFGETKVLKGVNFRLDKGEVLSIIGSSGNGKTTLLRCLNNLETADSGEITVGDKMIFPSLHDKEDVLQPLTFGMVFQSFNLFPQYSALENVTLAMNARAERVLKKNKLKFFERRLKLKEIKIENKAKAEELLTRVGLQDKMNNYPCELSGGQCQRVAIARALALSPEILCFDEPTSALDPELTGEVLKVIKALRDEGHTMIIVTHEIEFAKNVSDKVMFMADGQVAEFGTPSDVLVNPKNELTKQFLQSFLENK